MPKRRSPPALDRNRQAVADLAGHSLQELRWQEPLLVAESAAPVAILETEITPLSCGCVARNDMEMDLRLLVHQERKVELIRHEQSRERRYQPSEFGVECGPLRWIDLDDGCAWGDSV